MNAVREEEKGEKMEKGSETRVLWLCVCVCLCVCVSVTQVCKATR